MQQRRKIGRNRSETAKRKGHPFSRFFLSQQGFRAVRPEKSARRKAADLDCGGYDPMLAILVDSNLCF